MKLEIRREQLLKPLQHVIGVVERRQTLPILANVLMVGRGEELCLTATDLEVELTAKIPLVLEEPGAITLPARKLLDILRALPEEGLVSLAMDNDRALIRCGRSRFVLTTLPVGDFPTLEELSFETRLRLPQAALKTLIERTHFAMAQQDVRYYLNGLLLDLVEDRLRAVATDGHRLALSEAGVEIEAAAIRQVIVPRKGVQELLRLVESEEAAAVLGIEANHIRAELDDIRLTSKLIDGRFPDYGRVIPPEGERAFMVGRLALRAALARAAILSNDKYHGVRLQAEPGLLRLQAHNPEQEEAEDELEIDYAGEALEIGFNVTYLLEALGALSSESVQLSFTDSSSSCLIQTPEDGADRHVIMPMRL